jgi:site-specific DNA-methyltransferase (cytosine-N4-specific)
MNRPTRSQLLLPLLETLRDAGGSARPSQLYDSMAEKLGLDEAARNQRFETAGRQGNDFERSVRWLRQSQLAIGTIDGTARGIWTLTDEGYGKLGKAKPGILITIFETGLGRALWGQAESAIGAIDDGSVDLVFSSPAYPYANKIYDGGRTLDEKSWVDWMMDLITALDPKISASGSMMWNVGETYVPGSPHKSEHLSRLRVRLADTTSWKTLDSLYWHNPSRLPAPHSWVASRRIRLKPSVEPILWIGKRPEEVEADNRRVLVPYSASMLAHLDGRKPYPVKASRHPSGHRFSSGGWSKDNGGSIAPHLIACGASGGNRDYYAGARADGLPLHPAIMPQRLAEFCIALATKPMGLVCDPLAGSLTTAAAAEKLGRRWLASDQALAYIAGGRHRFAKRRDLVNRAQDHNRA